MCVYVCVMEDVVALHSARHIRCHVSISKENGVCPRPGPNPPRCYSPAFHVRLACLLNVNVCVCVCVCVCVFMCVRECDG
jgi:hypothetical protein